MRLVIDTNVLFSPAALTSLAADEAEVVLPAIAYAERARQFASSGRSRDSLDGMLGAAGIVVEPFGPDEAVRYTMREWEPGRWRDLARDAMIAGHLRRGDLLWTANPRDFLEIGVPEAQIVDIGQLQP